MTGSTVYSCVTTLGIGFSMVLLIAVIAKSVAYPEPPAEYICKVPNGQEWIMRVDACSRTFENDSGFQPSVEDRNTMQCRKTNDAKLKGCIRF